MLRKLKETIEVELWESRRMMSQQNKGGTKNR